MFNLQRASETFIINLEDKSIYLTKFDQISNSAGKRNN